jgi:hypothetical protein
MKTNEVLAAINQTLDEYRERLDVIPDEQFTETPPQSGWSYAEVYSHILQADLGSSIAMERCINGTAESTKKGLNWLGRLFFMLNRFPPVRAKAPAEAKVPVVSKISKEEGRNLIVKCRRRLNDLAPKLAGFSPYSRIKHPRLGMLNAWHWYKFILIHTRHHLKQLDRIAKEFKSAA